MTFLNVLNFGDQGKHDIITAFTCVEKFMKLKGGLILKNTL